MSMIVIVSSFVCTTTLLLLLISTQQINGQCQLNRANLAVLENERSFNCQGNFVDPGIVWAWNDSDNDEYHVEVRNADTDAVVYQSPEYNIFPNQQQARLRPILTNYNIVIFCDNERDNCIDGIFSFKVIECSCPAGYTTRTVCFFDGDISRHKNVECEKVQVEDEQPGFSTAPITGRWLNQGSGPRIGRSTSASHSTTRSQEVTNQESTEFTAAISAGFEFGTSIFGVGGTASVGASVSSAFASVVSQSASVAFSASESETFQVDCGEVVSSTGLFFLWQWEMTQPTDSSNGVGFNVVTNDYVCTASLVEEPRCPLGYCADLFCQTCLSPYDNLSAAAVVSPTTAEVTSPSLAPIASPTAGSTATAPTTSSTQKAHTIMWLLTVVICKCLIEF